jgi:hypothetical protein
MERHTHQADAIGGDGIHRGSGHRPRRERVVDGPGVDVKAKGVADDLDGGGGVAARRVGHIPDREPSPSAGGELTMHPG